MCIYLFMSRRLHFVALNNLESRLHGCATSSVWRDDALHQQPSNGFSYNSIVADRTVTCNGQTLQIGLTAQHLRMFRMPHRIGNISHAITKTTL